MYGCCAPLFKDSGEVCVAGGAWEREPQCIAQGEARAVSLAPSSFAEVTPKNLRIFIGNTTAMNAMKGGCTHSDALVLEPSFIGKALQEQGAQACWSCIASAENLADWISRGNKLGNVDVASGGHMRRGAWKSM
ncbi:hypothetical protein ERJ75_001209200 [Trypanosoma vivax]|nr:hypothetical protein ERJ75_001209200 [Trypanosoma vivax]